MDNNAQVFDYNGKSIHVIELNGEPWFILKDVCEVINFKIIVTRIEENEISQLNSSDDTITIINWPRLSAILERDLNELPESEPFCDWIIKRVLPSFYTNGQCKTLGELCLDLERMFKFLDDTKDCEPKIAQCSWC